VYCSVRIIPLNNPKARRRRKKIEDILVKVRLGGGGSPQNFSEKYLGRRHFSEKPPMD